MMSEIGIADLELEAFEVRSLVEAEAEAEGMVKFNTEESDVAAIAAATAPLARLTSKYIT